MSICAGVIISVTFEQVNNTPHTKTCAKSDHKCLENGDCLIKKFHTIK